ncbi:MAG: hypothetical protein JEY99_09325 [Spirochaetales bacterium]|nr:hypothetical protein [Spirochaetales bacterium]
MKFQIFILFIIVSFPVFTQNFYYDDISSLEYQYLEQGMGLPFKSFPYTANEFQSYLDRIDPASLSKTGKIFNDLTGERLKKDYIYSEPEGFKFDTGIDVILEGFYHKNLTNNFDFSVQDYIWQYGFEERHPLFEIPLEADILDILYVKTVISAKEEHMTVNSPTEATASENNSNVFDFDSPAVDIHVPYEAIASLEGEHWTIQLGRDNLSWGNGQTGNLVLSDYSDFYDYLMVNTWWHNFKFSTVYIVMDEYSPRDDREGDYEDGVTGSDGIPDNIGYQAFIGHRFDLRFFKRLNFAFVEAVTYMGEPFLIHDLNSLMAYHNWTIPEKANSLMCFELEYIPWKYFYLYGQLAMDEAATKYEEEGDGGGGQSTWAWLAGLKGAYPLGPGYIHGDFEFVHTDPYLYHRRRPPYFYNVRKIWSVVTDSEEYIIKPIGHETGPDAELWHVEVGYDWSDLLRANLSYDYLVQGETTIDTYYDRLVRLEYPVGIVETVSVIHLGLESHLFKFFSAGLDFYYIHTSNFSHVEGQTSEDLEIAGFIKFSL